MTSNSIDRARGVARIPLAFVLLSVLLGGCTGTPTPSALASPSLGPRPSSPAKVEIIEPQAGSTVTGETVHIELKLSGAKIVPDTTTSLKPDEGHVHLYVNNVLVSMNYGLEQDIPAEPGSNVIKAEFVAADHAPFNPRIWSPEIVFTVRQ